MHKLNFCIGVLFTLIAFSSCQSDGTNNQGADQVPVLERPVTKQKAVQTKTNQQPKKSTNYLCKVNGESWYYSESFGLINKMFGKNGSVVLTFKFEDHRDKTIQLRYDYKTNELVSVLFSPIESRHGNKPEFQLTRIDKESLKGEVTLTKLGEGDRLGQKGTAAGNGSFTASLRDKSKIYEVTDINFEGASYMNMVDFDITGRPRK